MVTWQAARDTNVQEALTDAGWPDAECFSLSCKLHDAADLDFNGLVDLKEGVRIWQRLAEALHRQSIDPNAEVAKLQKRAVALDEAWVEMIQGFCREVGAEDFKKAARAVLAQEHDGGPRIIVGPVIGKVTDSSARILVEINAEIELKCTLTSTNAGGHSKTLSVAFRKLRPGVFVFEDLEPGTKYTATFEGAKVLVDCCSFRTIPKGGWRLDAGMQPYFAVASCNEVHISRTLPAGSSADLWRDLQMRLQQGMRLDYLLQLGDNVYNDSEWYLIEKGKKGLEGTMCKWGVAYTWLKALPKSQWHERQDEIAEVFRAAYRETWGHAPTRWVLANVPNLMIFDDHDIRDDWGDRPEDIDENSMDWFLASIAYGVILEYQRQLYTDVTFVGGIPERPLFDYQLYAFGDIGIMFVDVRACKTFHRKDQDRQSPMLGLAQWRALQDAMAPDTGTFSQCRALLALLPEPIAYVSNTPTMIAGQKVCDDLLGQWSATKHQAEVPRFLNMLTQWRHDMQGREVIIIGGDVHEGGWTDLTCKESPHPLSKTDPEHFRVRQLTTSAIAQKMTQDHEAMAVMMTRDVASAYDGYKLGGGWTNQHYDWTNRRNYALVDVFVATGGVFKVKVISGSGLKNVDGGVSMLGRGGKSDPYVVVTVGEMKQKTKYINDNLDPVWNEEFTFTVDKDVVHVKFKVYDKGMTKDTLMGEVKMGIYGFPDTPLTQKVSLGEGNGMLEIEGTFVGYGKKTNLCKNGCGRNAFKNFATCCTHCKTGDGPHSQDCHLKSDETNAVRQAKTADFDGASVVIGGQLVASNGKDVQMRKRRTTKDPVFSSLKGLQGITQELGSHARASVTGLFSRGKK
mmetsp:Transcript_20195/g.47099  ORF Transcript_20195/g.47099 Transcript_20195/m.47099 type:complete len:852 (-) Transcript_20195:156-2711(-)